MTPFKSFYLALSLWETNPTWPREERGRRAGAWSVASRRFAVAVCARSGSALEIAASERRNTSQVAAETWTRAVSDRPSVPKRWGQHSTLAPLLFGLEADLVSSCLHPVPVKPNL